MRLKNKTGTRALPLPLLTALLLSGVAANCVAQIKTDGSLGHPAQTLTGPGYLIPQSLGLLSGNNLFQSFQTFNILTGQSATFTTSTPGIGNVISRVTGGSASQINGALKLVPVNPADTPNFFFINPAGIIFGSGAAISVPGAFHLGTADYVRFSNGKFYADLNQSSTFSTAPPEAFGFLGVTRATVAFNPGANVIPMTLSQPVSIVAGDITIDGGQLPGSTGIISPAGDVRVMANGQFAQEIPFTGALPAGFGNLSIVGGGSVQSLTIGPFGGGNISIAAGDIKIESGSYIFTGARFGASGPVGNVTVAATGNLAITNGGQIISSTSSSSSTGTVQITAASVNIDGQGVQGNQVSTGIFSQSNQGSTGSASPITVAAADNLSVTNGGQITSNTLSSGNAGAVQVNAGTVFIDGQGVQGNQIATGIFSHASQGSTGNSGAVIVTATGNLSVTNGGELASGTFSSGSAGTVQVNAANIVIDGQGAPINQGATGIFSQANLGSTGNAGSVNVTAAGNLSVINGGEISSSTLSSGNAGTVQINAGSIVIDGQAAQGNQIATGIFSVADQGSTGNAGSVTVTAAGNLSVINGGEISSRTLSSGGAGTVQVSADTISIDGFNLPVLTTIDSLASAGSSGIAGSVDVKAASSITLLNGGELSIQNFATVPNPAILVPTVLSVSAPTITMQNAQITAASTGNVAASDIKISFSNQLYLDPSSISTSANLGNGGSIVIQGGNVINLNNSQITTSVAGPAGNGGNISIGTSALVMNTGFIQANTAAQNASGGLIDINVQTLVTSGNTLFVGGSVPYTFQPGVFGFNVIQAAAPTGVSGVINITSPVLDITGSLRGLNGQTIDMGGLGRSLCQTSGGSSLAQAGRGGLPPSASGLLRAEPTWAANAINTSQRSSRDEVTFAMVNWTCN